MLMAWQLRLCCQGLLLLDSVTNLFVNLILAGAGFNERKHLLSESSCLQYPDAVRANYRDCLFLHLLLGFEIYTDYQDEVVPDFFEEIEDDVPLRRKTLLVNGHIKFKPCLWTENHHFKVNLRAGLFASCCGHCCWHIESPLECLCL